MSFEADVTRISRKLGLPKLTRLSGLKEAHARFEEISRKLDSAYASARRCHDMPTVRAVASIWAEMCADNLLCKKLLQRGILFNILELIALPTISPILTFRLLALATYYGDESVQLEAARRVDRVLFNVSSRFHDDLVVEYGLAVLAHCTEATIATLRSPKADRKAAFLNASMQDLVTIGLGAMRKPNLTHNMATHALALLTAIAGITLSHADEGVEFPSGLFVALTKTGDPSIHATAFDVLLRLNMLATLDAPKEGNMSYTLPIIPPTTFPDLVSSKLPSDIRRLLGDFGIQKCETFQRQMLEDRLARSLVTLGDNGNAYMYAYTIAVNIPFISLLNRELPRIKKLLKRIVNTLPPAALALRGVGGTELADTVQLFYANETLPRAQVSSLVREVIARNRFHTYAFVVKRQHENKIVDVPVNKNNPADIHLLRQAYVATIHSQKEMAWKQLRSQDPANRGMIKAGVTYCHEVIQAAEDYLSSDPPPDALDLPFVLEVLMLCKLLDKGIPSDKELDEIRGLVARHELSIRTLKALGYTVPSRPIRATFDSILRTYQESTREWGRIALHVAALARTARATAKPPQAVPPGLQKEVLVREIDDMRYCGPNSGAFRCACGDDDAAHPDSADLNRCSWCGTSSAMLRKCARCRGAFYCNASCQKSHWAMHKPECKVRSS